MFGIVRHLLDPLIADKVKKAEISADEVIERLGWLARGDIRQYMTWDKKGRQLVNSDQLTDQQAACIQEVSVTTNQWGTTVNLRLYDKAPALNYLMRYHRLDKRTVTRGALTVNIYDAPPAQHKHLHVHHAAQAELAAPKKKVGEVRIADLPNGKGNGNGHGGNGHG